VQSRVYRFPGIADLQIGFAGNSRLAGAFAITAA
jgi:hypothetical protein